MPLDLAVQSPLKRTLEKTRRRLVLARCMDGGLLGAWVSLAVLIVIVTIAIFTDRAVPPWCVTILLVGAAAGALIAMRRTPTLLDAAVLLDRRHALHELLSTAWMLDPSTHDDWAEQLRRLADQRVATIGVPSIRGRFAPRLHAATCLLAAGVTAGAWLLPSDSSKGGAQLAVSAHRAGHAFDPRITSRNPLSTTGENETLLPRTGDPEDAADSTKTARAGDRPTGSDGDAQGAGRATQNEPMRVAERRSDLPGDARGDRGYESNTGESAAGVGRASKGDGADTKTGGRVTSAGGSPSAPWELDAWSERREAAMQRIAQGRVPDAYQPLVREYFNR